MGFFDNVKKAGTKTKLQGEIALLDREIAAVKREFGVTLFDACAAGMTGSHTPALFNSNPEVQTSFEKYCNEVLTIQTSKDAKVKEIDHVEAKSDTRLPATSTQERFGNFSKLVGESTHATKLKAETALMDRNMKSKKEAFGTAVFDKVVLEAETLTGLKAVMSASSDKEIAKAIEAIKAKISPIINKKDMKNREIQNLEN
jgi:regulatory protein YycH of two-component signal transduction system YycFG